MRNLLTPPQEVQLAPRQHGFFDDFHGFLTATSTDKYTVVTVTDGTVLQADAAGGRVNIKSAVASAAGNEDCYLVREAEGFLLAAGKSLSFGALVQATEDDTNQNNLFVGLTDAAAADLLVNDGAGPKTSGTTLAFFKVDGGLNWWIHASLSTTQTSVELTAANSLDGKAHVGSGTAQQRLEVIFAPKNGTQADIEYYIDGVLVYKITDYVFTSATEMQAVVGCKDGDAADEVTIQLDYLYCYQLR
jgi:hypothetical protein